MAPAFIIFTIFASALERRPYDGIALEGKAKLATLLESIDLKQVYTDYSTGQPAESTCSACVSVVRLIKSSFKSKYQLKTIFNWHCLKSKPPTVCNSLSSRYASIIFYIKRVSSLRADEVCSILFSPKCLQVESNKVNWTVEIQSTPNIPLEPKTLQTPLKVLHISDLHLDPLYEPGSIANCDEPFCCRKESKNGDLKAGYWGQYWPVSGQSGVCDAPSHLIEESLKHIKSSHQFDYIVWTGDTTAHDDWLIKRRTVLESNDRVTKSIKEHLSSSDNLIIFPAIGNHEGLPNYQFTNIKGFKFSTKWIYQELAKIWGSWLSSEDIIETFKLGGYYSKMLDDNELKVIVLNTNLCSRKNYWNLMDPIDPANQLNWLVGELLESETLGTPVHLVGHIPPSSECTYSWLRNYFRILNRFQQTIKATFYGHLHTDEVKLYYNSTGQPVSVAYVGPSLVSWNPGFRVYDLNTQALVTDFTTYFLNLTEANERGREAKIQYKKLYSPLDSNYGLNDLRLDSWSTFFNKLKLNQTLLDIYNWNRYSHANVQPKSCDTSCKNVVDDHRRKRAKVK